MIRNFNEVSRFTVGTVGLPGERAFWIQLRNQNELISLAVEKSQVAALSDRLRAMLKEIAIAHPLTPKPKAERDSLPLENPIEGEFQVGAIALFYDEESERIQIDFRDVATHEDDEDTFDIEPLMAGDIQMVRLFISPSQALGFSERAELVVSAGRQPCPFCGFPINPDGHLCARANGYRR